MEKGSKLELVLEAPGGEYAISKKKTSSNSIVSKINDKEYTLVSQFSKAISEIFGDETTFCKLVFMDQSDKYDLVTEMDSKRLKILRELFDLSDLDKKYEEYNSELKCKLNNLNNLFNIKNKISSLKNEILNIDVSEPSSEDFEALLADKHVELSTLKKKRETQKENNVLYANLAFIRKMESEHDLVAIEATLEKIKSLKEALNINKSWKNVGCKSNPLPCVFLKSLSKSTSLEANEEELKALEASLPKDLNLYKSLKLKYKDKEDVVLDETDYEQLIENVNSEIFDLKLKRQQQLADIKLVELKKSLSLNLTECQELYSEDKVSDLEEEIRDLRFLAALCGKRGISLYVIKLLALELQEILDELILKSELNLKISLQASDSVENLDMLSILFGEKQYDVNKASGGEIALVKILFKLAIMIYLNRYFGNYKVLLVDEPTAALDDTNKAVIVDLIKSLKSEFNQIIVVSHDPKLVNSADNRIAV